MKLIFEAFVQIRKIKERTCAWEGKLEETQWVWRGKKDKSLERSEDANHIGLPGLVKEFSLNLKAVRRILSKGLMQTHV